MRIGSHHTACTLVRVDGTGNLGSGTNAGIFTLRHAEQAWGFDAAGIFHQHRVRFAW